MLKAGVKRFFVLAFVSAVTMFSLPNRAAAQTLFTGTATIQGYETQDQVCTTNGSYPQCTDVWPSGTVSFYVSGQAVSAPFNSNSTSATIASAICTEMNSSFPIQCTAVGGSNGNSTISYQSSSFQNVTASAATTYPSYVGLNSPTPPSFWVTMSAAVPPKFLINSILYDPPGSLSKNGFTTSNSVGTTSTFSSTYTNGSSLSFTVSQGSATGSTFSMGISQSTTNSNFFKETVTNSSGTTIQASGEPIDHTQDTFLLWTNAVFTTYYNSASATAYTYTIAGNCGGYFNNVAIHAKLLMNPSLIYQNPGYTAPTQVNSTCSAPALTNICANPSQCTVNDFQGILNEDPLISAPSSEAPSSINSNRYVYVNPTQAVVLQGSGCSGCGNITHSYQIDDSKTLGQSNGKTDSYSTGTTSEDGFNIPFLGIGLTFKQQNTITISNMVVTGSFNGQTHSATAVLGSGIYNCYEDIDVYEDTVYHTFVLFPPNPSSDCQ